MSREIVELHPCTYFHCNNCGVTNLVIPIVCRPGEPFWNQAAEQNDLPEGFDEPMIFHPESVKCKECGCDFHTELQNPFDP